MDTSSGKYRLRSYLWPSMVILLLVLQLLWPDRVWAVLLGILGAGWLIALLWARSLARNLVAKRKMRYGWTQVGDRLEERFILSNAGKVPANWLEVQDRSDLPGYNASCITAVDADGFTEWHTQGVCTRRGLFTIGPASLTCTDPLGLYAVTLPISDSAGLLVLPPVLALPAIEVASGGRAGEGHRPRRSALEMTVAAQTVREYIEGDPLRAIHWPTSARRNQLFVRQFEQMPSSDWWVCLDLYREVQVGEGDLSTEEYGVILAASLADRGLRLGHSVGLAACGQDPVWIPPRRTTGQLIDILRALAMARPGSRRVEELLDQVRPSMRSGASMILITPDLRPAWISALLRLTRIGVTPTVLLFDPASFGGQQHAWKMADWFQQHDITSTVITADLLDRPVTEGHGDDWEWRIVGSGKAVPVRKPIQVEWRHTG
jgi:uncharacterized protein (DUF58 family)